MTYLGNNRLKCRERTRGKERAGEGKGCDAVGLHLEGRFGITDTWGGLMDCVDCGLWVMMVVDGVSVVGEVCEGCRWRDTNINGGEKRRSRQMQMQVPLDRTTSVLG